MVRGWRTDENVTVDKPYYSVREEIERLVTDMRTPPPAEVLQGPAGPGPQAGQAAPPKPGQRPPRTPPRVVRPERP